MAFTCHEENNATAATGFGGEYYEEVDEYEESNPYAVPSKMQDNWGIRNQGLSYKNQFLNQQAAYEKALQQDSRLQEDISHCLYCLYNNAPMEDYFMRLISIQKRFKDFKNYVDPKFFLGLFIKHIKDFMKGIRKRILIEMR
jgi:hypothetical protein